MTESNDQNGNGGTAVTEYEDSSTIDQELERLRRGGAALVQKKQIVGEINKLVAGLTWGDVKGANLSAASRYALSEFCYITGANPHVHIDILGGRPYLNVHYWQDLLNADPHYLGYQQINISEAISAEYRRLAEESRRDSDRLLKESADLDMPELHDDAKKARRRAADLAHRAIEVDEMRAFWGVPAGAEMIAYVTIIRRYRQGAPLDQIVQGEIDGEPFIVEVRECNWAGAKANDPVGRAHPALTARSRSFRRGAVKSFSAWLQSRNKEIERQEKIIEAQFEVINADRTRTAAMAKLTPAIASGDGEPTATRAALPEPLPVRDLTSLSEQRLREPVEVRSEPAAATQPAPSVEATPTAEAVSTTEPESDTLTNGELSDVDRQELRKRLFPSLKECGITDEPGRKQWARENELPDSTKTWTRADFDEAFRILEGPARAELLEAVGALGYESVEEFCAARSLELPVTLKDVKALARVVQASR